MYALEELRRGPFTFEAGVRWDWHRTDPASDDPDAEIGAIRGRSFSAVSGSVRNHLSRTKDIMPEAGRGTSLLYHLSF